ncbi:MAG: phosphonopyruvate decarboxylase [Sulfuritalea sp.]|nr:phosphonopyruvate decarboxylase [Sulfuritalea sp.]
MLDAIDLCRNLAGFGFGSFSGIPCSFLDSLINAASRQDRYVIATNEGDAVAIAAGAGIGGGKGVVLMQNSGLTNAISPLTSLTWTFGLPVLGFVSLRGEPGTHDEPQHELVGRITTGLLDLMEIPWEMLSRDPGDTQDQLKRATAVIDSGRSFFFVVRKNSFRPVAPGEMQALSRSPAELPPPSRCEMPTRYAVLGALASWRRPDEILITTTGKTGRELHDITDAPGNLYLVGSMGCAAPLGLGLALTRPERRVIVIDGDGALLMRMGNLATLGHYAPGNLLHLLLDNNTHDSTGGQATVSQSVDFAAAAVACGYGRVVRAGGIDTLITALDAWRSDPAPTFIHLRISPGSKEPLGRPTMGPRAVLQRLRDHLR